MAAGDNSTVQITIKVVDANSGQVISQATKNLSSLGVAGKSAGDQVAAGMARAEAAIGGVGDAGARVANVGAPAIRWMQQLGDTGARVGSVGAPAIRWMQQVETHSATLLDKIRLLSQEFGIRLPRALETMLSRMPAVANAIGGLTSGLVAVSAIEIGVRVGTALYDIYKKAVDVNAEMRKFAEAQAQTSHDEFFNNASIETTIALLKQVQTEKAKLEGQRTAAGVGPDNSGSLMQWIYRASANQANFGAGQYSPSVPGRVQPQAMWRAKNDAELASTSADEELLRRREALQDRQQKLQTAQDKAARAGDNLQGNAAVEAKRRAQNDLAEAVKAATQAEEQYNHAATQRARLLEDQQGELPVEQRTKVYQPSADAGEAERRRAVAQNNAEAGAQQSQAARKNRDETLHAQAEANNAGLQGERKYLADYAELQRQLKVQLDETLIDKRDYYERIAALDKKYQQERQQRLNAERAETARMQAEAAEGGLSGLARVDAQTSVRMSAIAKDAPSYSDLGTRAQREAAVRQQGIQEQTQEQEQFSARIAALDASRAASGLSANARIEADTQRTVLELRKAWDEVYKDLPAGDARRVQGQQALDAEILRVQQDGARQQAEVRQNLLLETEKAEAEGNRRGMTREQEQAQAILDQYRERYNQLEELRKRDAANADLYRRQEIAAEEQKNGQLIELQRQMRDKLAGTLRGLMNNPMEELKRLGEDAASKYAASLVMKAGGAKAGGVSGGDGWTGMFGLPGLGGRKGVPGHPDAHAGATAATQTNVSAATTVLNTSQAVVNIQSATFAGMPGGAGAATSRTFSASSAGPLGMLPGASGSGVPGAFGGWSGTGDAGAMFGGVSATSDAGSAMPGITSTGGPAVAAARTQLGMTDAGPAPELLSSLPGMTQDVASLGKGLKIPGFGGDAGSGKGMFGLSSSTLGKVGGAAGGAMGLFSAFEGNGGLGGALQGGMAGMQLGSAIGGPIGAGIGAAAGAILGFIGFGGRSKAEKYYDEIVKPRIATDITSFGMGTMDYSSAWEDLVQLDQEARKQTKQFGMGGKSEWDNHIHPDIIQAQQTLTREQKAGRSQYGMSAAQFDGGGQIRGFGDMATGPRNGWINAEIGETVMHTSATAMHGDALGLMLAGANRQQMASYYGANAGGTQPAGGGDVNLHFHSHDAKGAYNLFMDNKHAVREAINASYAENSGGADL